MTELLQKKVTVSVQLLPRKATFAPTDPVEVDIVGVDRTVRVTLWHLDRRVAEATVEPGKTASFPPQPEGGYGVEAAGETAAIDVLAHPLSRPRYGFVSHYESGRETAGVATLVRRLHLNAVQFYDWMYRHARLQPPEDEFQDALGQPVSLTTVRALVEAVQEAGSLPMAYAAVYAVGKEERERWNDIALYRSDGEPWTLGEDFLWIVDPTNERWLSFFAGELRGAMQQVGFAGFHLDQYGAPKRAVRSDGTVIDLSQEFPRLIDRLAVELPEARLIFNNVNDFPTWTTANAEQAAIYIEVWPPHVQLAHLAELVSKARRLAPGKGVILAAYLAPYAGDEETASTAERLLLATVFSHGGSVLLHGEERAALTEAYYVHHAELTDGTIEVARRYYDFAVRYGDLLFDAGATDITRTHLAGENQEIKVDAPVPVANDCLPGVLWARVVQCSHGLLVSLIDLSDQSETLWNAPKRPAGVLNGVRVALERASPTLIFFASPESSPTLQRLEPERDGRYDVVSLPPFSTWALIWVRDETATATNATTTTTEA
jgi:dextranase